MQVVDSSGNVFGQGLEITDKNGKPKVPVINTDITIGTTAIVGGVSGRLLFDDAGIVGETNGVHWDKLNSRMGFGTTTPAYGISHIGNIGVAGIFSQRDFGFGAYSQITQRASYIAYTTDGTTGLAIGADSGAARIQGFNGLPATSDKPIFLQSLGGNVGIGTTTDAGFRLDINGTARIQGVLTAAGNYIQYGTNLNVGIGSTNNGSSFVNNGPALLYASANISATQVYAHNFFTGSFNSTSGVQGLANLTGANFSPTSGTAVFNTINATPTINQTGGASGITRGLYINPTLTAAADFRAIEANGRILSVYAAPFDTTALNSNIVLQHTNGTQAGLAITSDGALRVKAPAGAPFTIITGSIQTWFNRYNHSSIQAFSGDFGIYGSGDTQKFRIFNSTGNVLIQNGGTFTDAGYTLDINGTLRNTSNTYLATTAGSVGIGTTSPSAVLHIQSPAGGRSTLVFIRAMNSAAEPAIQFANSTNNLAKIGGINGGGLYFENATTELMRISSTGNLLLNTTTDAGYKLDINGTARVVGSFIASAAIGAGSGSFALGTLATAASSTYGGALGYDAQSLNAHALAFGYSSRANGHSSVAIGRLAIANAADSVAFHNATSAGINSAAFGNGSTTTGTSSMATGSNAYTYLTGQLAVSGGSLNYKGDSQYSIYTGNLNTGIVNSGGTYSFAGIRPSNSTFGSDVTQIWYVECVVVFAVKGRTTAITEFALRDTYSIKYKLAVKSTNSLGTTILGTPVADSSFSDASMATTSVTFTIVSNNLVVNVTPPTWTSGGQMQFRGTASFGITELGVYGQPF